MKETYYLDAHRFHSVCYEIETIVFKTRLNVQINTCVMEHGVNILFYFGDSSSK